MINVNRTIRFLWILAGFFSLICGLSALINPNSYDGYVVANIFIKNQIN